VIAPSVAVEPVDVGAVFDAPPGDGGGWFGYPSYPNAGADGRGPSVSEAAGGWSDCVLRQDRDGSWWYESLSGAALSEWISNALQNPAVAGHHAITWQPADRDAHRTGVLECLMAITAGEVYQACVCTQITGHLDGARAGVVFHKGKLLERPFDITPTEPAESTETEVA
jgi:para-aminobenzoate synthetase component 1